MSHRETRVNNKNECERIIILKQRILRRGNVIKVMEQADYLQRHIQRK